MLGDKNKKIGGSSFFQANMIGIVVLVALLSFLIGNRWSDILDSVGVKNSASTELNTDLPADLNYEEVEDLYDLLRREYDGELQEGDLINGLKEGLASASGDVYTTYLNAEAAEEFNNELNGTFSGIGAELGINDSNQLIIVSPIDGFPAQKAGVRPQDIIVEVDGEESINWSIEKAVNTIRGPEGTEVKLVLARDGQRVEVAITRESIVIPSVESEVIDGIGYLKIGRFAEDTVTLARTAADDFVSQGVEKVVLDLRNNGGGFLSAAVDIAGLWVPGQVIVEQREAGVVTESLQSGSTAPLQGLETIVLINGGSASASEIVAGALQDLGAAQLLGTQSFGKGSVQSLEPLEDGGILKVTIARWFTPNGRNIDDEGVTPDIELELSEEDFEAERDAQREKALELLKAQD